MRRHTGRRINAQLTDGFTITGTLERVGRGEVELSSAAAVPDGQHGRPAPIDGTVVIPRASILWVQVV